MNTRRRLIQLAIKNIDQIPSAKERIALLNEAADITNSFKESNQFRVTAKCLEEAENAQLKLIENLTNSNTKNNPT